VRGRALQFRDFSGGVNLSAGPGGLDGNEAAYALNFRSTTRGSLKSREGDTNLLDSADLGSSAMAGIFRIGAFTAGAADDFIIGMTSGNIYRYTSGSTATLIVGFAGASIDDVIEAPVSGGFGPVWGTAAGTAFSVSAAAAPNVWTATTGTIPSTAKYLAYVGNRVWAAGMTSYGAVADPGSALVFSNLGDPRDWPAANIVQFDPNDGEAITGIGEVSAGLLVFKKTKAWLVYDLDTGANRPLGVGVGCISHRSITQTPYGTIWAGDRQVWTTDGGAVRSLGDKLLSATPTTLPGIETYLIDDRVFGVYTNNRYFLQRNSRTAGTSYLFEYDFFQKSWWIHTTLGGPLALARIGSGDEELYVGGHSRLDRMFDTGYAASDGSALSRRWSGPYHSLGPGRDRLRGIEVDGSGQFGMAALPQYNVATAGLTTRDVRAEENLGATPTVRRESDFRPFYGVQPYFYATGVNAITGATVPGYTPTDVQIDGYALYITRRQG
jgi:hypothetical protein